MEVVHMSNASNLDLNSAVENIPHGELLMIQQYGDVITVLELAKILRIGRNSAYDLVNRGQVKSVRVGNQIRIPTLSVIEFLKSA